ncbi:MAG: hypothetical protein IJC67_01160, partial [Clostridia bacterium]|nr:hypothetical protein [Clostridia bacterium]
PAGDCVIGHNFVGGYGSYTYCARCDGRDPRLVTMAQGETKFEYFFLSREEKQGVGEVFRRPDYCAYIHAKNASKEAVAKGTKLRWPVTSCELASGESVSYEFLYTFAQGDEGVRDVLAANGGVDILAVPGYTVSRDLPALVSLRSVYEDVELTAVNDAGTKIEFVRREGDRTIWKVDFSRLGENTLIVRYDGGKKWTGIEFFITEPIETLINKRGKFIVSKQYTSDDKWYRGLLCEWNNETSVLLTPDNYDKISGWRIYEVASDDPGLAKPAFLSTKLAEYPTQEEVSAMDDYIEYFVWGGLQLTEEEEYPYAVLGTPDWHANRTSDDPGLGVTSVGAQLHFWRIYDYPHIGLMYYNMYRVARDFPSVKTRLSADEYLKRAYKTFWAMFIYPDEIDGWTAYHTGLYNELVIPDIISELRRTGKELWAQRLEFHWVRKVKYFLLESNDLFSSEYAFDTTGFESTHAFAKYGYAVSKKGSDLSKHPRRPDITYDKAFSFMKNQMDCNVSCRGTIEPAYYWYGSDYRSNNFSYTLSYMSQMGGWAILDYALYYAADPVELLRLGYGSMMSSWAMVNSGDEESNYGYFFPGKEHDGAASGGFEPMPYGFTWLNQPHHFGPWYYSCEIDLGFCGGVRGMATVLADDPIFGVYAYGGTIDEQESAWCVRLQDGVNRRFHYVAEDARLHLTLDQGRIECAGVQKDLSEFALTLDTERNIGAEISGNFAHTFAGEYQLLVDGQPLATDAEGNFRFAAEKAAYTISAVQK